MANVVPHIILVVVRGQLQSLLEAVERHVKLLGIEAAEAKVRKQLGVMDSHLEQPPGGGGGGGVECTLCIQNQLG